MTMTNTMLRVMSYNIRNDNQRDAKNGNGWQDRREMVASTVRFHRGILVGMQEVLLNQLEDLCGLLPEYAYVGVGRNDGKAAGEFAAIFYLRERLTVKKNGHFWLSERPDQPGVKGWDADCVRIVTWAEFTDQDTGAAFYHFNTHFDHIGMVAQYHSAYLLLNQIEKIAQGEAVLVTGDFNCIATDPTYLILTGKKGDENGFTGHYLIDAGTVATFKHHGPSTTTLDYFDPKSPAKKIDYIFIKNQVTVVNHGVLADHFDWRYSSDHMPVVADLIITADSPTDFNQVGF